MSFVDIGPSVLAMAGIEEPSYMQGSAQLALTGTPEREYIYASKDRLDEFSFRERAIPVSYTHLTLPTILLV